MATVLLQTHAPAILDGLENCVEKVLVYYIVMHRLRMHVHEQVIVSSPACGVWPCINYIHYNSTIVLFFVFLYDIVYSYMSIIMCVCMLEFCTG